MHDKTPRPYQLDTPIPEQAKHKPAWPSQTLHKSTFAKDAILASVAAFLLAAAIVLTLLMIVIADDDLARLMLPSVHRPM